MSNRPRLGVVIPSYNHEQYIGKAVDSCLGQTRPPDRIIVIDDGSSDRSIEILKAYAGRGEIEFTAQENAGAHATIGRCIARAAEDCDLISILNSDDHYVLDRFEKCLPWFEQNPEKSVLCTGLNIIGENDAPLDPRNARMKWFDAIWSIGDLPESDLQSWLGQANFPATTSNVIARTSYLTANPFRPYRFNHDYYFLAKAVLEDQLGLLAEKLCNYRVHSSNTITTAPAPLVCEMLRMHLDLLVELEPRFRGEPELRRRLYRYLHGAADNVSSLHGGLLQLLLVQLAASTSEDDILALVESLDPATYPELENFPNRALINAHDPKRGPLSASTGLAEKFQHLRGESARYKADARASKELAKLRNHLLSSKWVGLGRIFGACRKLTADAGGSPQEKLENHKVAAAESSWLALGRRLGVYRETKPR
jgi:glycosyltransferase involved in cell wall biosynthesis